MLGSCKAQNIIYRAIMRLIENIRNCARNIPEFSEKNYNLLGYVFAALITITGLYLIYEAVTTDALVFKANWNMFKSPLGNMCLFIGFFWAIAWWGKFTHWSATPITKTYDGYGNLKKVEEDYDISNQMFAKFLMPVLGHFVIEPIIYGAIIYYPIQCIIAIVGSIFPYILALIVLGIIAGSWMFTRTFQFRYHSVALVAMGILFTVAFGWGGYAIGKSDPGSPIQMLMGDTSGSQSTVTQTDEFGNPSGTQQQSATSDNEFSDSPASSQGSGDEFSASPEEDDEQFEGVGEEGLYGSLPAGTTEFVGDMAGFPIEFSITKSENMDATAVYKNVKYGTTMTLTGETLPAMGGDIHFYGNDGSSDWVFMLTGDMNNIKGKVQNGGKELNVTLKKK